MAPTVRPAQATRPSHDPGRPGQPNRAVTGLCRRPSRYDTSFLPGYTASTIPAVSPADVPGPGCRPDAFPAEDQVRALGKADAVGATLKRSYADAATGTLRRLARPRDLQRGQVVIGFRMVRMRISGP